VTEIKDATAANATVMDLQYYYGGSTTLNGNSAVNNGSPTQIAQTVVKNSQTYSFTQINHYDTANRLSTAGDANWSHTYGYDQFGNMWLQNATGPGQPALMPTTSGQVNSATNRVNVPGVTYDPAGTGNATVVGPATLTYDTENRVISDQDTGGTMTYTYDGLGQRVTRAKGANSTTFVYDAFGNLAAEYATGTITTPPCLTCYVVDDALGSTRVVANESGAVVALHDFYPFGYEVAPSTGGRSADFGSADNIAQKFTDRSGTRSRGRIISRRATMGRAWGGFWSPIRPGTGWRILGTRRVGTCMGMWAITRSRSLTRAD